MKLLNASVVLIPIVSQGEMLVLFNSAIYLEIAINEGNAASLLGLKSYSENSKAMPNVLQSRLFYQTIKVFFE